MQCKSLCCKTILIAIVTVKGTVYATYVFHTMRLYTSSPSLETTNSLSTLKNTNDEGHRLPLLKHVGVNIEHEKYDIWCANVTFTLKLPVTIHTFPLHRKHDILLEFIRPYVRILNKTNVHMVFSHNVWIGLKIYLWYSFPNLNSSVILCPTVTKE